MIRLGINGLGRIGRYFLRLAVSQPDIQVVAVNSPGSLESSAHLIQYDSVHGRFSQEVHTENNQIHIGKQKIHYSQHKNPENILWKNVDIVVECSGVFKEKEFLKKHFKNEVKKVLVSAPAKGADWTVVYGVNHKDYQAHSHHIVSNASCTTNALAPLALVLDQSFGIEHGYMTTVHAYTSDQKLLDAGHRDLRRARAAGLSLIPTSTGAATALEKILPHLKGKLQGLSVRVPTANVSLVELAIVCKKEMTVSQIHHAFKQSRQAHLKNILDVEEKPLVSCDFIGSPYSTVVDAPLTKTYKNTAQVFAWYDNEAGFCSRLLDVISFLL